MSISIEANVNGTVLAELLQPDVIAVRHGFDLGAQAAISAPGDAGLLEITNSAKDIATDNPITEALKGTDGFVVGALLGAYAQRQARKVVK
jgi:hypothetical protein